MVGKVSEWTEKLFNVRKLISVRILRICVLEKDLCISWPLEVKCLIELNSYPIEKLRSNSTAAVNAPEFILGGGS